MIQKKKIFCSFCFTIAVFLFAFTLVNPAISVYAHELDHQAFENHSHEDMHEFEELFYENTLLSEGGTSAQTEPLQCVNAKCKCKINDCSACWKKTNTETDPAKPAKYSWATQCKVTGDETTDNGYCKSYLISEPWARSMLSVLDVLNQFILPVFIAIGAAGTIFVIILGVKFSKAESSDDREEQKKKLIGAVIGVVIMIVALIGVGLFTTNATSVFEWISEW